MSEFYMLTNYIARGIVAAILYMGRFIANT